MTFPDMVIHLAIVAAITFPHDIDAAVTYFTNQCRELGYATPANIPGFINYWRNRHTPAGDVIHHNHNAGRPRILTVAQVERAYKGIIGWEATGRSRPYESHAQIMDECQEVQAVLAESGASYSTLIKACRDRHPHLGWHKLVPKWELTAPNKTERVDACTDLRGRPAGDKYWAVFLDAKSIHMQELVIHGWVDASVSRSVTAIQAARSRGKVIVLRYYAAVNAQLGPILLKYYTGTTGMDNNHDGKHYKVSHAFISLGGLLSVTYATAFLSWALQAFDKARSVVLTPGTSNHNTLKPALMAASAYNPSRWRRAAMLLSGLFCLVTSLVLWPSPWISINRLAGVNTITSHLFLLTHAVVPSHTSNSPGSDTAHASTAYVSIESSASHNLYTSLS